MSIMNQIVNQAHRDRGKRNQGGKEVRNVNLSAITKEFVELQVRSDADLSSAERDRQDLLRRALMLGGKQAELEPVTPNGQIRVRLPDGERISDQQIDRIEEGMFDARLVSPAAHGDRMVVLVEPGPGRPALASYAVAVSTSLTDPSLTRFRLEKS